MPYCAERIGNERERYSYTNANSDDVIVSRISVVCQTFANNGPSSSFRESLFHISFISYRIAFGLGSVPFTYIKNAYVAFEPVKMSTLSSFCFVAGAGIVRPRVVHRGTACTQVSSHSV